VQGVLTNLIFKVTDLSRIQISQRKQPYYLIFKILDQQFIELMLLLRSAPKSEY